MKTSLFNIKMFKNMIRLWFCAQRVVKLPFCDALILTVVYYCLIQISSKKVESGEKKLIY